MILKGIPSGDCECWVFLVDKKTFEDVKGKWPAEEDVGRFAARGSRYRYMLYPSDLLGYLGRKKVPIVLSVDAVLASEVR